MKQTLANRSFYQRHLRLLPCDSKGFSQVKPLGFAQFAIAAAELLLLAVVAGCGLPGPPQPPSLDLPVPVQDLRAERAGDSVRLRWTDPSENTDKTPIRGPVSAVVCRGIRGQERCTDVGSVPAAPGRAEEFVDALPPALRTGVPAILEYRVSLLNHHGATAGPSEGARCVAGAAPAAVEGLQAEAVPEGVLLRWRLEQASGQDVLYRISRHTDGAGKDVAADTLLELTLPEAARMQAEDNSARRGAHYVYRVQPVLRVRLTDAGGAHYLDLAGPESAPEGISTDVLFAPAAPEGLVAVAAVPEHGAAAVDLSWEPVNDASVAGYVVLRREEGSAGEAARVSPEAPLQGTSFHDTGVVPGRTYIYTVVAVGAQGARSQPSAPAREAVPAAF